MRIMQDRSAQGMAYSVRSTREKYGIGWTMWDYSGGFGVVVKQDGRAVPDELTVKALGRVMPAVQPQR